MSAWKIFCPFLASTCLWYTYSLIPPQHYCCCVSKHLETHIAAIFKMKRTRCWVTSDILQLQYPKCFRFSLRSKFLHVLSAVWWPIIRHCPGPLTLQNKANEKSTHSQTISLYIKRTSKGPLQGSSCWSVFQALRYLQPLKLHRHFTTTVQTSPILDLFNHRTKKSPLNDRVLSLWHHLDCAAWNQSRRVKCYNPLFCSSEGIDEHFLLLLSYWEEVQCWTSPKV